MAEHLISTIVEQIADAEGVDAAELGLSLGDYVDLDALETLAAHDSGSWALVFETPTYEVTVRHDGSVSVSDIDERNPLLEQTD
ncbi:HalOD1 output domain-containing protein [Halobellus sp. GM3]|uniref:HalOD1 output domain-containing protein n=1 Tax=Halobellus sp. GM3 TaxID=3458410 RepID=UPI00403D963D